MLIITKMLHKNFFYLAPSASLTFQSSSKHVKKRTWVNYQSDMAREVNLLLVITSHVGKCHAYRNTALHALNDFKQLLVLLQLFV